MVFGYSVAQARKFLVALIGVILILANSALTEFATWLSPGASVAVTAVLAVLTAAGTFLTKNAVLIDDLSDGKLDGV